MKKLDAQKHSLNLCALPGQQVKPRAVFDITPECKEHGSAQIYGGPILLAYGEHGDRRYVNIQDGCINQHIEISAAGRRYYPPALSPRRFDDLFRETATRLGIDPKLLDAMIERNAAAVF
jgi:hypothetical protein